MSPPGFLRPEGDGEEDHEGGRLGQKGHHHLPAASHVSEGGSEIHGRHGHGKPGQREETDKRDGIGDGSQGRGGAQKGNKKGRHRHDGEKERRDNEEKRRMPFRKNHLLAKEARKISPGLQNPSGGPVLENGPDGADPSIQKGGHEEDKGHLKKGDCEAIRAVKRRRGI